MSSRRVAAGFLSSLLSILSSRVLGFVREVLTAYYFGASGLTDAYFLAWKIPNIFRRVLAEGGLEKVFLPLLKEGFDRNFVQQVFFWVLVSSFGVALLIAFLSEEIVFFLSPEGGDINLASHLLEYLAFYLPFAAVSAFFSALLQYRKSFFLAYFSSTLFNLTAIGFLLLFADRWGIYVLVWGVLAGGLAQLLFSMAVGIRFNLLFPPKAGFGFKLKKFFKNLLPSFGSLGVGQISTLAEAFFATHAGVGVLSGLYYAFRLVQLPISAIGVSSSRVNLSYLTTAGRDYSKNPQRLEWTLKKYLLKGGEVALFFAIPSLIGLLFFAKPIVGLVYERGAFGGGDTERVALYLQLYALGLPAAALHPLVANIFYIKERFYLGFFLSSVWLLVELLLPAVGLFIFHLGGWVIALSYSVGGWFTFLTLGWVSNSLTIFWRSLLRLKRFFPLWGFTALVLSLPPLRDGKFLTLLTVVVMGLLYLYLFKREYLSKRR